MFASTKRDCRGGEGTPVLSIRGGVEYASTYSARCGGGFHGNGTSMYPAVPHKVAVLSAWRSIPQVKLAMMSPGKCSDPDATRSTPVGPMRAVACTSVGSSLANNRE